MRIFFNFSMFFFLGGGSVTPVLHIKGVRDLVGIPPPAKKKTTAGSASILGYVTGAIPEGRSSVLPSGST